MKQRFAWVGAALMIFCASCGSDNSNNTAAAPAPAPSTAPAPGTIGFTSVSESAACEAMDPNFCSGAYGFRVFSDGHYIAGPAQDGTTHTGQVAPGELDAIRQDVELFSQSQLNAALTCRGEVWIPGIQDKVQIYFQDQPYTVYELKSDHGVDCYSGSAKNTDRLHADLLSLVKKYYPVPFSPSPSPTMTPLPSPSTGPIAG